MNIPYVFHPRLIVRTPCRPFESRLDSFDLDGLCRDKAFLEAIFLASPVLHAELVKYREGQLKDERAIHDLSCSVGKYYLRMSSRCTPFGLFSGCGVAVRIDIRGPICIISARLRSTWRVCPS
jgi:hypothetical protein